MPETSYDDNEIVKALDVIRGTIGTSTNTSAANAVKANATKPYPTLPVDCLNAPSTVGR